MKRRAAAAATGESDETGLADQNISHELAFQDLTDRENPNFRYVY